MNLPTDSGRPQMENSESAALQRGAIPGPWCENLRQSEARLSRTPDVLMRMLECPTPRTARQFVKAAALGVFFGRGRLTDFYEKLLKFQRVLR